MSITLDTLEAVSNALVGLVVSWLATWGVLGYAPTSAIGVTLMFFALSFARSWVLRALFRGLDNVNRA